LASLKSSVADGYVLVAEAKSLAAVQKGFVYSADADFV